MRYAILNFINYLIKQKAHFLQINKASSIHNITYKFAIDSLEQNLH